MYKPETDYKKKILIHIGTAKTGSTAIQESLTLSSKRDTNDILYVGKPNQNIAPLYYDSYQKLPREFRWKYSMPEFKNLKKQGKTKLIALLKNHQNIIISSEYLSMFKFDQIKKLRMDLDTICDGDIEYQIVVYIREPASYYLSIVQQQLKASSSFMSPMNFRYRFIDIIKIWGEIFAPEQINVRVFNRELFPDGSVILDFQNIVETFFKKDINLDIGTSAANESLSAEAMIILQKYRKLVYPHEDNTFKKDSNVLVLNLQKSKDQLLQTKPQLLDKVATYIRQKHANDIHSLRDMYGIEFPKPLPKNKASSLVISLKDKEIDASCIEEILEEFDIDIVFNLLLWIIRNNLKKFK